MLPGHHGVRLLRENVTLCVIVLTVVMSKTVATLENHLSVTSRMREFVDGRSKLLVENTHGREIRVGTSCQTADRVLTTPPAQLQV
ncbi:hypothetical protein AMECASPLE_038990 [Ameca splendens]|uniref:Secreted protein n=1 Tax=Ameca splendens TaxID=208324 RepID=A0ABV1A3R3_9TELE